MHLINDDKPAMVGHPIPWEEFTKIRGDNGHHIEQLWDEVKSLRQTCESLRAYCSRLEDDISDLQTDVRVLESKD